MSAAEEIPCGCCASGIYDIESACGDAAKSLYEGRQIPRCKRFDRPCVGATHLNSYFNSRPSMTWNEHVQEAMK